MEETVATRASLLPTSLRLPMRPPPLQPTLRSRPRIHPQPLPRVTQGTEAMDRQHVWLPMLSRLDLRILDKTSPTSLPVKSNPKRIIPLEISSNDSDNANFINVCAGQTLTNGIQITTGSCNGIPLGFIPSKDKMPSSLITFPEHNQDIAADQTFNIEIITTNMQLGHFTNAKLTYYSAPTRLNGAGLVIGHTHITCQDLGGSFTPSAALDSSKFAFFLGINTPADANSKVIAKVPNGLPAGFYRCCTMVANANHSPLQMPVAQRGAQDDCRYFSAGQGAAAGSGAGTGTQNVVVASSAAAADAATSAAPAAATSAAAGGRKGRGGRGAKARA